MLHDVIKKIRGNEKIVFTGDLAKARDYAKRMRDSQRKGIRGSRVEYRIVESIWTEKFKERPHYPNGRDH